MFRIEFNGVLNSWETLASNIWFNVTCIYAYWPLINSELSIIKIIVASSPCQITFALLTVIYSIESKWVGD